MKLVADIDTIKSNLGPLSSEIDDFNSHISSFDSASINCNISEISELLDSYKSSISSDLSKLNTSSGEYKSLVDTCCNKYKNNEGNIQSIDISNINDFISENPDVTFNYKGNTDRITTLPTNTITRISKDKYINVAALVPGTKVYEAYQKYKDELENCKRCYVDADHFIVVKEIKIGGVKTLQSHIVVNNGTQINGAPANGKYAHGLETSTHAAKRLNSILLINGSHFQYSNGAEHLVVHNNVAIVNGKVVNGGRSGGHELFLDKNGNIFYATGVDAHELVKRGVKYSFSCHSTPVIRNGDISPSYRERNIYNRTLIGQSGDCEYYVLTDMGSQRLSTSAKYLKNKGCKNAFSLDQGGSVSLDYGDESVYYKGDKGKERAVGDFLYFV